MDVLTVVTRDEAGIVTRDEAAIVTRVPTVQPLPLVVRHWRPALDPAKQFHKYGKKFGKISAGERADQTVAKAVQYWDGNTRKEKQGFESGHQGAGGEGEKLARKNSESASC